MNISARSITRIRIISLAATLLSFGLFILSTTASSGGRIRYERVYPNGYVEVSDRPFTSDWNTNPSFGQLSINLPIWAPESVGVTHAYIPVSIEGSSCPFVRAQILFNAPNPKNHRESDIIVFSSSNPSQTVITRDLVPGTPYLYRIIARGCDQTVATYERELTTLPDPRIPEPTPSYSYKAPAADPTPTLAPTIVEITSDEVDEVNEADEVYVPEIIPTNEEPYEESYFEKDRGIRLPTSPRDWIAVALLLLGTLGIIASFIVNPKKNS